MATSFVSASPNADTKLIGASNGNWVRWYVEFGTTPLEIGYNPNSRFATALKTEPWYKVVTQPGFLLGRTDPATDPKGALAVTAIKRAAAHRPRPRAPLHPPVDGGGLPRTDIGGTAPGRTA